MNENTLNNDQTMNGANATVLVNRYRIVRQLGQGGMGSVWLAEDSLWQMFDMTISPDSCTSLTPKFVSAVDGRSLRIV